MPLYRLDFLDTEDKVTGAVTVSYPDGAEDFLCRHMTTARAKATETAQRAEVPVAISTIKGAGILRRVLIANPDGTFRKPTGASAGRAQDECEGDRPGARCFCPACRAKRRAERTTR